MFFVRSLRFIAASALLLTAVPQAAEAKPFKGAEIFTTEAYRHGRVEVRMRTARGSGILSTFFTYKDGSERPDVLWEEIDVEVFGKNDARSWQSNIITGGDPRTMSEQVHTMDASLADAYHTYALEWAPGYVAWSVDGVESRRTNGGQVGDLVNPQSVRANLWAAEAVGWVGPFEEAALPQHQFINWIKFYRYENGTFVLDWQDDFDTFDGDRWGKATWTFDGNRVDFSPDNVSVKDGTLVLSLTREGQTGFTGEVPEDEVIDPPGGAGSGGSGPGTSSSGSAGGAPDQGAGAGSGGSPAGAGGATPGAGGATPGAGGAAPGGQAGPGSETAGCAVGGTGTRADLSLIAVAAALLASRPFRRRTSLRR